MELSFFYTFVGNVVYPFATKYGWSSTAFYVTIIVATVCAWATLFLLQAFGLRAMAKRQGVKGKWMAFFPCLNIYFIGKLAGECEFFGQKMKRAGVYAMIAQILVTVLTLLWIASEAFLVISYGAPSQSGVWSGLVGFSNFVAEFYGLSVYISLIFELIATVMMLILLTGLYKKYSPRNYFILGLIAILLPVSRFIVIFVLRNKQPIDYNAYMRARREAYMRQQQQYQNQYGNPYANGYGGAYGGAYRNPYGTQNPQPQPPEDPFSEFNGKSTSTQDDDDPFMERPTNDGGDGFFD